MLAQVEGGGPSQLGVSFGTSIEQLSHFVGVSRAILASNVVVD